MTEQRKYSLSDSDMLGIFEQIDSAPTGHELSLYGVRATWNAILAQEGLSWNDYSPEQPLNPSLYAIPREQSTEIIERMKKRAMKIGLSSITTTNVMMDYMNWGPLYYE